MTFLRNVASSGGATLLSRVLGFARDTMVAAALGAGPVADAFVVAIRVPGLMRRLFAEGAVNSVFVPAHEAAARDGVRQDFCNQVLAWIVLGFSCCSALALVFMPQLISVIAPGFSKGGGHEQLAVALSRITFLYCLATALAVVAAAVLNAHGRFIASSCASALANGVTIISLIFIHLLGMKDLTQVAYILAWTILAGGVAQALLVFAATRHARVCLGVTIPRWTPRIRSFFLMLIPGISAAGIAQVNAFVGLIVASPEPGAVTWLYYADRVYQLPLGILAVGVGSTLLPTLSRGSERDQVHHLSRAMELAVFFSLPAALALIILAEPVISVLFERGAFTQADTVATALALAAFAAGMPAFVGAKLLQSLFFSRAQIRSPFLIAVCGVLVDVVLSVLLFPVWHQFGIACAAAVSGWLNFGLLAFLAWRAGFARLDPIALRRLPRLVVSAVIMAVCVWILRDIVLSGQGSGESGVKRAVFLASVCAAGFLAHLGLCLLFKAVNLQRRK